MTKDIKFGTTVRYKGSGHDQFMVLDTKPAEKKGDWASWYKVIRLSTESSSDLHQRSVGEIAFIRQDAVVKVDDT